MTLRTVALWLLAFWLAVGVFLAMLVKAATAASLADRPSAVFDAVAAQIAGHPVHAWCEDDPSQWTMPNAWGYTYDPNAFTPTDPQYHVVYLHPWICGSLHDRLDGRPVAMNAIAEAIHVLVHESVHQRGGVYSNCTVADDSCEGRTDCLALTLDEQTEETYFGYQATVTVTHKRPKLIRVRVHGRLVKRWRATTYTTVERNPELDELASYQHWYHAHMPAQYRGGCK